MDDLLKTKNTKSIQGFLWTEKLVDKDRFDKISKTYQLNEFLAKIISNRNIELEFINDFLKPKIKNIIPNPSSLLGLDSATKKIVDIILKKKKIGLFGDFDVDGITSTSIFCLFLKHLDIEFDFYIPNRIKEGYGPNLTAIEKLSSESNCDLIITLDCGITSTDVISQAKQKGISVIVVDHHIQSSELPDAVSIVNPNQKNDKSKLINLAAVGVTFMLLISIRRELLKINYFSELNNAPDLIEYLDLVALGTVCDVMPQDIYNRSILTTGLKVLNQTKNKGIKALITVSGIGDKTLDEYHLAYILGPRINAGGRLGDPSIGVDLLTSDNEIKTNLIAQKLNDLNSKRKKIEQKVEIEAIELVEKKDDIICIHGSNWHQGVIGIVASRLVERFLKPVIIISEENFLCKGSCRSIGEFDIGKLINSAYEKKILEKGGGHKMAAGLSIKKDKISEFKDYIKDYKFKDIENRKFYDFEVKLSSIDYRLYTQLQRLSPFGNGNPKPLILIKNCIIKFSRIVGDNHISCLIGDLYDNTIKGISFKANQNKLGKLLLDNTGKKYHIIGNLNSNFWNGEDRLQINIVDILY